MTDQQAAHILRPDTQAVLLLCGRFGGEEGGAHPPLTPGEYDKLAGWLMEREMRPADLLTDAGRERVQEDVNTLPLLRDRLIGLLDRGVVMALAVEGWTNKGLWVISRSDPAYPVRLRGRGAPPLLYGAGRAELLAGGGLAVVGSRHVDLPGIEWTRGLAGACAAQGIPIISGGARGVDSEAIATATAAGGTAVAVLADSLLRAAVSGRYLTSLLEGSLVLITPYDPAWSFRIGRAMGRNKYIYALADWAAIVSSSHGEGGTWAGAIESLKIGKTPTFVRLEDGVPEGNTKLIEAGALSFPAAPWPDLAKRLSEAAA